MQIRPSQLEHLLLLPCPDRVPENDVGLPVDAGGVLSLPVHEDRAIGRHHSVFQLALCHSHAVRVHGVAEASVVKGDGVKLFLVYSCYSTRFKARMIQHGYGFSYLDILKSE